MLNYILLGFVLSISAFVLILIENALYWNKLGIVNIPFYKLLKMMINWYKGKKQLSLLLDETFYKPYPSQAYVGLFKISSGGIFIIRDPKLVQTIMTIDFPYFIDRTKNKLDEKHDPHAVDLNSLTGSRWKIIRNKSLSVFSPNKLKQMFPLIEDCTSEFDEYLSLKIQKDNSIQLKGLIDVFITKVSFKLAFGMNYNSSDKLSNKFEELKYLMNNSIKRLTLVSVLKSLSPKLASKLKLKVHSQRLTDLMINIVQECRQNRGSEKKNDFLQSLIDIQEKDDNTNIDENTRFSANIVTAAIETYLVNVFNITANTICHCIYELGVNQEIQIRLQNEIRSAMLVQSSEKKLTYDTLNDLPYLELVLKETLRKYPPIPFTARTCTKNYTIPGSNIVLKKGTIICIPIYSYHNDPQYFPQPQKFDPERFLNWDKNNPTYIPFGSGPRMCIATRMAKIMIKIVLASLLQDYTFLPTDKTEIPLSFDGKSMILKARNEINLKVIRKGSNQTPTN